MNTKRKIEELGAHYKVTRGSWNYRQWSDGIKRAAGTTDKSIEVLWDELQKTKQAPAQHGNGDNSGVVSSTDAGQSDVLPPLAPDENTASGHPLAIHVHSPQALPAQVVEYPPRDFLGFATRVAAGCQTLALGLVMGVLISKPVLKFLGY